MAFTIADKLRPQLAGLMGHTGFRALLTRSLANAAEQISWLRTIEVSADGYLNSDLLDPLLAPEEITEGNVVWLANLLGLLMAFIGDTLTLRLVREVWPWLPLNLYFNK